MTDKELRGLGPALADYLDRYLFCCAYTQTFAHLGTYVRGLLSDLERKTCEPIALKAGTPVRSLQEFLRDHVWDFERVKQLHQLHSAELLHQPDDAHGLGTIGLIDETSAAKKGDQTPGVLIAVLLIVTGIRAIAWATPWVLIGYVGLGSAPPWGGGFRLG